MTKAARKHNQYIRAIMGCDRPQQRSQAMTIQKTDGLTNSEIMARGRSSGHLLTVIQRQVQFLMREHLVRKACPNCGEPHNLPEAANVSVDEFDFGDHGGDRVGPCRKCRRTLIYTLPLVGGWHWRLDPDEATISTPNQKEPTS